MWELWVSVLFGHLLRTMCLLSLSCVLFFTTPLTVARQTPLPMGFPRQEYWNKLPFPSSEDLPDTGIKPTSPAWQEDSLALSHLESPTEDNSSSSAPWDCLTWDKLFPKGKGRGQHICDFDEEVRVIKHTTQ